MMIKNIQDKKKRFLITMIIIMVCATMVNYGLYNILSTYVKAPSEAYAGVQWSIIYIIVIIAVVTVIMLAIIPKENINELLESMENPEKSPEQQLRNMADDDLDDKK